MLVFEGMNLFISPHNDDETLFGAYTLCRERETIQVVVVFDGWVQKMRGELVTADERREETVNALKELGVVLPPIFAGFNDATPDWGGVRAFMYQLRNSVAPVKVYVPQQEEGGHTQHNALCVLTYHFWYPDAVVHYTTYTDKGKSIGRTEVQPEPDWIVRKLRALACYRSQIAIANCREHFTRGLNEYYA